MSFQDAAAESSSNYEDKGGVGFATQTQIAAATNAAPRPSSSPHDSGAGPSPSQLLVTCDGPSRTPAIYEIYENLRISCRANPGVEITGVAWMADEHGDVTLFSHKGTEPDTPQDFKDGFEVIRIDTSSASMDLSFVNFGQGSKLAEHQAFQMFIRTNWTQDNRQGYTNSFAFTTTDDQNRTAAEAAFAPGADTPANDQKFNDDKGSSSTSNDPKNSAASSASGGHTATQPTNVSSTGTGSHKGGLSTGAIAGIAVAGAVVFLGVVGAFIWFLIRRKKQNKAPTQYSDETKATAFLHAKDGVHHTDSAVAPYSDDGYNRRASAQPQPQAQRSESEARQRQPVHSLPATASEPPAAQPVSSSVAHLVEEGMTEADIRRLEEEERHLDAEIERNAKSKSP